MKRFLALLLSIFMLLSLGACSEIAFESETTAPAETYEELIETSQVQCTLPPAPTETVEYPEVVDKISWNDINAFPIANASMTTDELRALCINFMRFSKTFAWTPDADYHFMKNAKGAKDSINAGFVYGGLPYVGLGSGSIYRAMDYYDSETGILNVTKAGQDRYLFGNQCSIGAYWGWGRVINSAEYDWTYNMVQRRGFLRVGPYTYDDSIYSYSPDLNTTKICANNGKEVMYQSYATLKPADGLVYYRTAGHVIMCVENHVVTNADGTINPDESYIVKLDQSQSWKELQQSNGEPISVKTGVDVKCTYKKLFEEAYLPFTFAEFLGTDPVEDTECTFHYTGSEITITKLQQVIITSNYGMSDVYVNVKDAEGKLCYTGAKRMTSPSVMHTVIGDDIPKTELLKYSVGFQIEVVCQLSNGARPVIYTGKLKG